PETVKDCIVYLTVPQRRQGASEVDLSGAESSASRLRPSEIEVIDTMSQDRKPMMLGVGKMRLQFALGVDDMSDRLAIPVARIIEVRSDREIVLDQSFIPACLDIRASQTIAGFIRELDGLLSHRMTAMAGRLSEGGAARGVAEVSDFLLLTIINRLLPQVRHMGQIENLHPEEAFRFLAGMAGELSVFMTTEKVAPEL
ncbi:unnamed protein product, partial [Ectocarpus sp. 12 AP-2014]